MSLCVSYIYTYHIYFGTGSDFALHLVFDLHTEDHYRIQEGDSSLANGLDVLVHHADNFPLMSSGSIQLSPGMQHYVAVQMSDIERLSKPYSTRECVEDKEYQLNECLYQCKLQLQFAKCDCKIDDPHHPDACTYYKIIDCYDMYITDYYNDVCDCTPPCSTYEYSVRQSSLSLPSGENLEYFTNMTGTNRSAWEDITENIVHLQIYFDSMEYTVVRETPAFGLYDLIANIGGLLGLFLGASLITIMELLEQGMFASYNMITRKHMGNKVSDISEKGKNKMFQ